MGPQKRGSGIQDSDFKHTRDSGFRFQIGFIQDSVFKSPGFIFQKGLGFRIQIMSSRAILIPLGTEGATEA